MRRSGSGLTGVGDQLLSQNTGNVPDTAEPHDLFGEVLRALPAD